MSIIINDPVLIEQLRNSQGSVILELPDGSIIGEFTQGFGRLPQGVIIPFSKEELSERSKQTTGRSLSEIMHDLEARGLPL